MLPVQSRRFSSIKGLGSVVSKRLLIVEDDPGLQSQMRWCFSDDIEVVMASDRDSAITSLRKQAAYGIHCRCFITKSTSLRTDAAGLSRSR